VYRIVVKAMMLSVPDSCAKGCAAGYRLSSTLPFLACSAPASDLCQHVASSTKLSSKLAGLVGQQAGLQEGLLLQV
jgi:hypothetical protein